MGEPTSRGSESLRVRQRGECDACCRTAITVLAQRAPALENALLIRVGGGKGNGCGESGEEGEAGVCEV